MPGTRTSASTSRCSALVVTGCPLPAPRVMCRPLPHADGHRKRGHERGSRRRRGTPVPALVRPDFQSCQPRTRSVGAALGGAQAAEDGAHEVPAAGRERCGRAVWRGPAWRICGIGPLRVGAAVLFPGQAGDVGPPAEVAVAGGVADPQQLDGPLFPPLPFRMRVRGLVPRVQKAGVGRWSPATGPPVSPP